MVRNEIVNNRAALLRRAAWVAGLLGLTLLAVTADRAGPTAQAQPRPGDKTALPADLERVPRNAIAFVSIRVADLWNSDAAKNVRQALTRDHPEVLKEVDKLIGVAPADIERLTLLVPELSGHDPFVVLIATTKPLDKAKVLKAAAPEAKEEKHKDHTVYVADRDKALCFLDDRTLAVAQPRQLMSFLDQPAKKADGPLSAALQAAAGKHLAVAGFNPAPVLREVGDRLPEEVAPFKSLLEAKLHVLTLDLGKEATAHLHTTFANADDAKKGMQAVQALLNLARNGLAEGIRELEKHPEDAKAFGEVLKQLVVGLAGATVQQKDASVQVVITAKMDVNVLAPAALRAVQRVHDAASRAISTNNLKQLALAMHNYHDATGAFPPGAIYSKDGKPQLSWRVLLLPYLDEEGLYKEFKLDEPWDSEHNKKLLEKMPRVFAANGKPDKKGLTHYQAFTGKGMLFDGVRGSRIANVTDGTSNTLMFVEAAQAVPWTKPDDLPYDPDKPLPKLGGLFKGGFNAAFCDGSVRFISETIAEKTLRALITPNGGEVIRDDF